MTNDQSNPGSTLEKVVAAARRDPKRSAVLVAVVLLLLTLWARMFLAASGTEVGPARAGGAVARAGSTSRNRIAAVEGSTIVGGSDQAGPLSIGPSIAQQNGVAEQRLRSWLAEPVPPIGRNLFAVKLDYYRVDALRPVQGLKTTEDGEFWASLEKSLSFQADQRGKRENLVANYKAEAEKLRLDSIIMGPQPKAMIEGKLVNEGEVAAGFRVLKIEPRRITIEREGIVLEIQMK